MRKSMFKKILMVIDTIELHGVSYQDTPLRLYEEIANDYDRMKLSQLKALVGFLKEKGFLMIGKNGIDLAPAPTIYAKSNQNSSVEALGLMESFLHNEKIHTFFKQQSIQNNFCMKEDVLHFIDKESLEYLLQTTLFEVQQNKLRFHPRLLTGIRDILMEYEDEQPPLVSCCLTALYTSNIVSHDDLRIDYKNTKGVMNEYLHKDIILTIIPRKGIPHDRDETKALQAFYKDTLFHEFYHACPICDINLPHMLIASHIKPFRDCAHIYEAIDHNNGLLLCRNHDYLFDQGYITFDERGYILLSKDILNIECWEDKFSLRMNYKLPDAYLTRDRIQFLKYHREHIFRK